MVITYKQDLVCFAVSTILETCNRFVHLTASSDRPLDVGKHRRHSVLISSIQ